MNFKQSVIGMMVCFGAGGAAWTLSIEDVNGRFVGAIAIQQASISLFGACTELD